jgi:type IV pilus assembly protein PilW
MLRQRTKGFTLIELLVVLLITGILLSSLISTYLSIAQKDREAMDTMRLDQSLQSAMSLMASDISRAGFWANASSGAKTGTNSNPFMTNGVTINATNDCILFTYDRDGDGALPSVGSGSDDEQYGFRLMNYAIQGRPSGAAFDCATSASDWENITDPNVVKITQLNFSRTSNAVDIDGVGAGTSTISVSTVTITLTGQLASNASVSKTLTNTVKIRNDKYTP